MRARWSTGRWELAAARGEGRKAGAVCGGTSQRPIAGGLEEGAQALETSTRARRSRRRKQAATEGQRHARGPLQNEGAKARANEPERGRPEGRPEGMAGDEGREPSVKCRSRKAAGRLSGGEGRKPGADLSRRAKPAGGSERTELRAKPKGQGKGRIERLAPKDASPNQGATAAGESTGGKKLQVQA